MDGSRFDQFTRRFAAISDRRRLIVGALSGAAVAGLHVDDADARPPVCRKQAQYCTKNRQCCNGRCRLGKPVPRATRNVCECDAPSVFCGKQCRDLTSDPKNCGACGKVIDRETRRCCNGEPTPIDGQNCAACGDVCGPDDLCCPQTGGCVDRLTDPNNCGECGVVCSSGVCTNGECSGGGCNNDECGPPCADVGDAMHFCVVTTTGEARYACYAEADEAQTCATATDCTGSPGGSEFEWVCASEFHTWDEGVSTPGGVCFKINPPLYDVCCYPESEFGLGENSYCFVLLDGSQLADEDDDSISRLVPGVPSSTIDYLTCNSDADCYDNPLFPDTQNLASGSTLHCVKAFNQYGSIQKLQAYGQVIEQYCILVDPGVTYD
jgi:hypothetical protein